VPLTSAFSTPSSLIPTIYVPPYNVGNISEWIPRQNDILIKQYWRSGKRIIHDHAGVGTLQSINDYTANVKLLDNTVATFPLETLHPLFYYGDHVRRLAEDTLGEACLFLGNPDWSDDGDLDDIPSKFTRAKSPLALVCITKTSQKVRILICIVNAFNYNCIGLHSSYVA
jgi:hypothetical protein